MWGTNVLVFLSWLQEGAYSIFIRNCACNLQSMERTALTHFQQREASRQNTRHFQFQRLEHVQAAYATDPSNQLVILLMALPAARHFKPGLRHCLALQKPVLTMYIHSPYRKHITYNMDVSIQPRYASNMFFAFSNFSASSFELLLTIYISYVCSRCACRILQFSLYFTFFVLYFLTLLIYLTDLQNMHISYLRTLIKLLLCFLNNKSKP